MTLEGGKPLIENSDEVGWTAACFDYYAEIGRDSAGRVIPSIESSQLALVVKEPLGVVGCIVPWNYPLLLLAWKLAPALAAGNTTVCKPSELTPLSTLMLAPLLRPPARRASSTCVAGAGDVGAAIVADERVDCVAFTGSVETGKTDRRAPAPSGWRGSTSRWAARTRSSSARTSPTEIDVAAKGGAWAAFLNAGQVCTSAERFYVMDDVYDDYLQRVRRLHREPRDRRPDASRHRHRPDGLGARSAQKVADQVEAAVAAGAEVVVGGDDGRPRARPLLRPGGRHRRAGRDRPAARGDLRAGRADRPGRARSTRRSSSPTRPASASAPTSTPRTSKTILRCMREIKAGHRLVQRPADRQRRRARSAASSSRGSAASSAARASRPSRRPSTSTSRREIAPKEWWYPYSRYTGGEPPHGA